MVRFLRSIDDLDPVTIRQLIDRSRELDAQRAGAAQRGLVGLLFLSSSLRTRVGFAAAAARIGLAWIDVSDPRSAPQMTTSESVQDTLRTLSGMVDVVVMRSDTSVEELDLEVNCVTPFVNGGDGGAEPTHPTQALIDLRAIEDEAGPIGEQVVAVSGDLGQRAARSLISLFCELPPRRLVLMGAPGRDDHSVVLTPGLAAVTEERDPSELDGVDVLYLPGLPQRSAAGELGPVERRPYAFTASRAVRLPADAVVLSPLPVVDEVADECRNDARLRLFGPSDRAISVRSAVLEWVRDD